MDAPRIMIAGGGTGGHLVPALNLAAALRRVRPDVELLLLGARRGLDARVLPASGLPYRLLPMQPLWRGRPWRNWRLAWTAPTVARGLSRAFRDLDPHLVLGTGGYASGPALAYGITHRLRTAIQEQNARPGLVTRLLAPRVDQVHLGWPEARDRLRPGRRTRVFAFGNPVAPAHVGSAAAAAEAGAAGGAGAPGFEWPAGRIVGVVGGSQGARGLNERLLADLRAAAKADAGWPLATSLVWVAGEAHAARLSRAAAKLPWADRIRVVPFIPALGAELGRVTLAVSRAGAMLTSELAAAGVPAVLVPFPASAGDHQRENARALQAAGAAILLEEDRMRTGELWDAVIELLRGEERRLDMAAAMRERGRPDAADRIARTLLELVGGRPSGSGSATRGGAAVDG